MSKIELKYSAQFKRDYVAKLAELIFFAIVGCELALAVSIPLYLRRESAMAREMQRLQLLESFDATRSLANRLKTKSETAELELRLIRWDLNLLANYLRREAPRLSRQEIADLQANVRRSTYLLTRLEKEGAFCTERTLDTSIYIDSLLEASGGKP